jgi:hypothetical protein
VARKARIDIWFFQGGKRGRIQWPGIPNPGGDTFGRDKIDFRFRGAVVSSLSCEPCDNVGPALEAINDFMATIDAWKP